MFTSGIGLPEYENLLGVSLTPANLFNPGCIWHFHSVWYHSVVPCVAPCRTRTSMAWPAWLVIMFHCICFITRKGSDITVYPTKLPLRGRLKVDSVHGETFSFLFSLKQLYRQIDAVAVVVALLLTKTKHFFRRHAIGRALTSPQMKRKRVKTFFWKQYSSMCFLWLVYTSSRKYITHSTPYVFLFLKLKDPI